MSLNFKFKIVRLFSVPKQTMFSAIKLLKELGNVNDFKR